ncbi:TonB-dependent receptor [Azorhizobium oxalatiphilum]|uniref:TonB-dependent receptor n=2 Tax=Azorhizobium oxalatiphilum TaxID=980631 RepID=A0A917C119_9HYPH|nr:TonB-dependent receptor [Azorhizobium oxalatiphilum]
MLCWGVVLLPAGGFVGSAMAQGSQSAPAVRFAIPAQPLPAALDAFIRATGWQVGYSTRITDGIRSSAVSGTLTPAQALRAILAGTGLSYTVNGPTTVTIQAARSGGGDGAAGGILLDTVDVQGETAWGPVDGFVATRTGTGSKTDAPIIEIPQTINVVTADQMQAQGAQSVSEALRYTPGVRSEGYGAASPFDVFTQVRGFRADLYLDGLRLPTGNVDGTASGVMDTWGLERLEVLQGPASGLYGQSGPGGIINMVSKRPTATPLHEVQVQGGSFDRIQGAFDFGGPVNGSDQLLYRFTGLALNTGSQLDYAENDRVYVAPAVTWKPNADTSLTILAMYQRDNGNWPFFNYMPAIGSLYSFNGLKIGTDTYLGEPDFDQLKRTQASIGYEFQHRFNEHFAFKQNLRFNSNDFFTRGAVTGRAYLNDDGTIDRLGIRVDNDVETFAVDNQLKIDFATGPVTHDAVIGLDYWHERSNYLFTAGSAPSLNVFLPVYNTGPVTTDDMSLTSYNSTLEQVGVYVQDRIKFDRWVATLGGRYDRATSDLNNNETTFASASTSHQSDGAFTGRAGLTYLFESGFAPYVSYATSFQPEAGVDAVTDSAFKPSKGKQFEVGVKYQPPGMKALFTIAAFDLTQTNMVTTDELFMQRQIGEVNVKGIEFEAKAEITPNFNIIASYAYLDPKITQSANPAEVGLELFSTPNHQGAFWGDYGFTNGALAGLTLGAGVRYVGSTTDSTNTLEVPAVTLFDARVKYDLGKLAPQLVGASFAVTATNIFDTEYVSQCDGDTMCTYGTRRVVLATLNYKW